MENFLELIEQTKEMSPKERRETLLPFASNANISRAFSQILANKNVRSTLRALSDLSQKKSVAEIILHYLMIHEKSFVLLLSHDDPKVRKTAAELLGKLAPDQFAPSIMQALSSEPTDFVRPSMLLALGNAKNTPAVKSFLATYQIPSGETKHMEEQSLALKKAKSMFFEPKSIKIIPLPENSTLLLSCPNTNVTAREVKALGYAAKQSRLLKNTIEVCGISRFSRIFAARSFYEASIYYDSVPSLKEVFATLSSNKFADFVYKLYGKDAHPYRIELSSERKHFSASERKEITGKIANILDRTHGFINSPSSYLFEIVLVPGEKDTLIALRPSSLDDRFSYREEAISASIHPAAAASLVSFLADFTYADSAVLDCFCGSGTLLFERAKLPYRSLTGSDISPIAIRAARKNERHANTGATFFAKNALDPFREQYDEVFSNLPFGLRVGSHKENTTLYKNFLENLTHILSPRGIAFLFTNEKRLLCELCEEHFQILAKTTFSCGGLYPGLYVLKPLSVERR